MATETLAAATKLSATHASLLSARREAIQLSQAGYTAQEKNSMTFISDSQRLIELVPSSEGGGGDRPAVECRVCSNSSARLLYSSN